MTDPDVAVPPALGDRRHHRPQKMTPAERQRMAREIHHLLALNAPLGVALNDDWANLASDVPEVIHALFPLLCGVQEGFRVEYRDRLGERWGVRQREDNDATAGVALIWDRHRARQLGRRHDDPGRIGHGWRALGHGADTRVRGVVWQDLELVEPIEGMPTRFRAASWHREPIRNEGAWPAFDRHAVRWLHQSPLPTIVFQDGNEAGGPAGIVDRVEPVYGWHGYKDDIDGALAHRSFHCGPVVLRPRKSSDHNAAVIPLGTAA